MGGDVDGVFDDVVGFVSDVVVDDVVGVFYDV